MKVRPLTQPLDQINLQEMVLKTLKNCKQSGFQFVKTYCESDREIYSFSEG